MGVELSKTLRTLGQRDGLVFWAVCQMNHPTNAQLASLLGISERTVQNAISSLVKKGLLLRWVKGPYRRLTPAPGLVLKAHFQDIPEPILRYLEKVYGPETVAEAISVLEYTYALSNTKPRSPVAVLRAVLRSGKLRYPPGYKRPDKLRDTPVSKVKQAASRMKSSQLLALQRKAYTYLKAKGLDHQEALARCESIALLWIMTGKVPGGD